MVSAAGLAPAIARSQTEHVAATPRAGCPGGFGRRRGLGSCGDRAFSHLVAAPHRRMIVATDLASSGEGGRLLASDHSRGNLRGREDDGSGPWLFNKEPHRHRRVSLWPQVLRGG